MRKEKCIFNGVTYYRYPDAKRVSDQRYFKRQGSLLHRAIWEHYNGPIPKKYHVHHKDGNPGNNALSNLEVLPGGEHMSRHNKGKITPAMIANLERIRPLATEWHRSKAGRKWHSEHGKETFGKRLAIEAKCERCGSEYKTKGNGRDRFCSLKCKAAARRAAGIDNVPRACRRCGKLFEVDRYVKKVYCSAECRKDS